LTDIYPSVRISTSFIKDKYYKVYIKYSGGSSDLGHLEYGHCCMGGASCMDNKLDQSQLDLRLFRIWMKASTALSKNIHKDIESYNLNLEYFMILELLFSKGPHAVQKISETLSIPSGSITYVVNKLEKLGLVARQSNLSDRRAFNVVLTEKGEQLFNEIFPKHVATISENLSFINDEEKELLIELMKKIGIGAQSLRRQKDE
jgi:MarR family 2-MHQ and catechol resistance regulon transcriptional repressor